MFSQFKKILLPFVVLAIVTACTQQTMVNNNSGVANSGNTNTNTAAQPGPDYSSVIVTLPIVDALLHDEEFRNSVKSELALNDEELKSLVNTAREAVLQLEENGENDDRSTTAAAERAEEKLREALGQEKASRLMAMVRQHIAGGENAAFAKGTPNSVPTDSRIVVNAPAYRMDVFENGQLKKSYKVGIGYPEFPLPVGLRTADTLIFNPTWTPPDEPWVKGKVSPGETVDAGSKLNPLGIVKIPIGLPSLIHAGKSESRLGTFASHGCVGLTNDQARDFSLMLSSIGGSELSESDITAYGKEPDETKEIKLARDVPVELRYETIVVEDGKLLILRDVYERGTNTEENLRRVLQAHDVSFDSLQPADKDRILAALKKMAVDAGGDPVEGNSNSNSNSKPNTSEKVTRNIKGEKRITIELAELRGKGYPAPVDATF